MAGSVANAYVQIIPSMEGATNSITQALTPGLTQGGAKAGQSFGLSLAGGIKGKLVGVGATILASLGVAKIASGLLNIGDEFKSMSNTIEVGTGTSGAALDALCDSAKNIATTVPTSFEDAGDVVQDLNTRMGLVGDDLEDVGERVVAVGNMMGDAIDLDQLTGTMNAFGVSNDEVAGKMDYLFGICQTTGIGFDDLTGIMESNAGTMQSLGFDFEETANMAGLLDKAGLDASSTMSTMSRALVNLSEPGEDTADTFNRCVKEMGDFVAEGDEASALDIATTVFGTKGATKFVQALENGTFNLDEISNAALGAGGNILETQESTMTWSEKFDLLKNKAKVALEPLAGSLTDGVSKAFDSISEALGKIDPQSMEKLGEAIGEAVGAGIDVLLDAFEWISQNFGTIASVIAGVAGGLVALKVGMAISGIIQAFSTGMSVAAGATTALSGAQAILNAVMNANPIVLIVSIIAALVAALITAYNTSEDFRNVVDGAFETISGVVGPVIDAIVGFLGGLWDALCDLAENVGGFVEDVISFFTDFGDNAGEVFDAVGEVVSGFWDGLSEVGSNISGWVEDVGGFFSGLVENCGEWFGGIVESAQTAWEELPETASGIFDTVKSNIGDALNTAKEVGGHASNALQAALSGDWNTASSETSKAFGKIKGFISDKLGEAKESAVKAADKIGEKLGFPGLGKVVSDVFDKAQAAIEDPMGEAKKTIGGIVEDIKGFFNFEFKWPDIPMPKFSINPPNWKIGDLLKGSIPSLSVSWAASGGIVTDPSFLIAGEAGPEAIVPLSSPYVKPFAQAVAAEMSGSGASQVFNIYANDPEQVAAMVAARERRAFC